MKNKELMVSLVLLFGVDCAEKKSKKYLDTPDFSMDVNSWTSDVGQGKIDAENDVWSVYVSRTKDAETTDKSDLKMGTELGNFLFEVSDSVFQMEITEVQETLDFSAPPYLDECPEGGECYSPFYTAICFKSNEPEISGFKSLCTAECEVNENGKERVIVSFGNYDGDCDSTLSNGATCCGFAKNPATDKFKHYCLLETGGSCCYNSVYCLDQCCPDGVTECAECGCLQLGESCCQGKSCDLNTGNVCDMCGCHSTAESCCPGGEICPDGYDCAVVGENACVLKDSMNCGNHYCPPKFNCLDEDDECCPMEQDICSGKCCEVWQICNEVTGVCMKKPKCDADEVACKYACCKESEICSADENSCEAKCAPPTPNFCFEECCPNNYTCECEGQGGVCLPGGAELCDCKDKSWCEPLQECIKDSVCHKESVAQGKLPCKPLGAEDCPEAGNCYCDPGQICTHKSPACCPSDTTEPCGDYCCPKDSECLPEIKDCLPSGWDYCPKWGIKCGVGLDCKELESGCKNDNEKECGGGKICLATENCVGDGKGEGGCCSTNQPIACDGYCCPTGTHCDAGCGGCVVDGYKCCSDGQTECLNEEICWKGGAPCLASGSSDCGSYWCDPSYVCSSGPQQCCAETTPQTCGDTCCSSSDSCVNGVCIPAGGEYCPGSPNNYCGTGNSCGKNWTEPCCCGTKCMQPGEVCCDTNSELVCKIGTDCCQVANTVQGTLSACVEAGGSCCLSQNGSNVSLQLCDATQECCSMPGYLGTKITHCKPAGGTCFFAPGSWTLCSCPPDKNKCGWHCLDVNDSCCSYNTDYYCQAPAKCGKVFGYKMCFIDKKMAGSPIETEYTLGIDCSSE